ncbi:MAG TPA: hypothetical protein VLQ45_29970 [Thermoanaerobaculia bacterium]|nr:hypothetical protein [Thermoanaerobaculia bacterium]
MTEGAASTAKGTFGVNPTFDVPVLDSQEFMFGFLAPVKPEIMAYYWDQGWPQELLLHLLVQKARVQVSVPATGEVEDYYYWNHPDRNDDKPGQELCKLEKFTRWVNHFVTVGNPSFRRMDPAPVGPEHASISVTDLVSLLKEGYDLSQDSGGTRFRLTRPSKTYVIQVEGQLHTNTDIETARDEALMLIAQWARASRTWDCSAYEFENYKVKPLQTPSGLAPSASISGTPTSTAGTTSATTMPPSSSTIEEDASQHEHGGMRISTIEGEYYNEDSKQKEKISIDLYIRSPEAALYYLGQVARVEKALQRVPMICIGTKLEPLFLVRTSNLTTTPCTDEVVSARYDATWYTIPEEVDRRPPDLRCSDDAKDDLLVAVPHLFNSVLSCDGGRSMHALNLLTQLINLQKSSKDLPSTGTVRVVGQQ